MAIQPTPTTTTGTTGASSLTGTAATTAKDKTSMGKDDFLKLLVGQLKNQDPQNPTGSDDFMGQMAQFSRVEQLTNLTSAMNDSRTIGLLGHEVTYTGPDKKPVTGKVESVNTSGASAKITIGGIAGIDPTTVTEVR
jgi:flagellar basal-body rod modification protein FlgD